MRVAIAGDFDPGNPNHPATEIAIAHSAKASALDVSTVWVPTSDLREPERVLDGADGLFLTTGSPYRSLEGALAAIRHARVAGLPFVGTCGGFQHVVLEAFRDIAGLTDAAHGEYEPDAPDQVIAALSCSVAGQTMQVQLERGFLAANAYGQPHASERYYCTFGVADGYRDRLGDAGLTVTGTDVEGEARVVEFPAHLFFMATLYVPQATSTPEDPHPIITAFLRAAAVSVT